MIKIEGVEHHKVAQALGSLYETIYLSNLVEDTYELIKGKEWIEDKQVNNTYSKATHSFAHGHLAEEERDYFLKLFSIDNLKKSLTKENRILRMDCRHLLKTEAEWFRMVVMRIEPDEGEEFSEFIFCIESIQNEKAKVKKLEEQTSQAMIDAYEAAKNANTAKTQFLSKISHDIRTPLNAIQGMTNIAYINLDDTDKVRECLEKVSVASNHLMELINDVLDVSRIELGRFDLKMEEFNLKELVQNCMTVVRVQAKEKNHTLDVNFDELKFEKVEGDSLRIQQVLINLLSNAVKYTPAGGNIKLTVSSQTDVNGRVGGFDFIVEDNGIGMTKDFLEVVFDPFARADDSRIRECQGNGLGMSIVNNIICMMDGKINVESEINKGTKVMFTIYLKIKDTELMELEVEEEIDNLDGVDFSDKRLLIVEDNDINREIIIEILKPTGIQIEEAEDGLEGLEKIEMSEEGYYDIVLMDIRMPKMDGYSAAGAIRALDRNDVKTMPIVALSANAFAQDVQESKDAGMDDHIAKPLDIKRFYKIVRKWIK